MSWNDYLQTLEEAKSYRKKRKRKSGAGLERSLKWFLDKGPQKKGGYPKKRRPNFRRKKFNDISAPPGAPGGLEEVELSSFKIQDNLQEDIWEEEILNPEVKQRLIEIVEDFITGLEIPVTIEDIKLTGSLANYNWSRYSDIDVHILVDFSKIDDNIELVKAFFDEARMRWNDKHQIMVHDFEVEIYVEDVNEEHHSTGLYSIMEDEWIIKPERSEARIDFETAQKKAKDFSSRVESISQLIRKEEYEKALTRIERVKAKIRSMRKAGLESEEAEFSPENIAFKILRRDEILLRLNDLKREAYDQLMTMREE